VSPQREKFLEGGLWYTRTSIHATIEELYLGRLNLFTAGGAEHVPLIDALGRVYRIYLYCV